jgi:hypothetical protein
MTDDDIDEMMRERVEERYRYALMEHPDCADPGHPGCEVCDD